MEKNEIIIRNVVMHILNTNNSQLEFSDTLMELSPDINEFLRNHIYRILESDETKECEFEPESQILPVIQEFTEESLIPASQMLAYTLYEIMIANIEIPPADLFLITFQAAGVMYLAILKMNYKETYIHCIEKCGTEVSNSVIKQKAALPSLAAKLTEAAVVNLHNLTVDLIEKKYEVNGVKTNYFSTLFLQCRTKLSNKQKLNILTRTMEQINRKYYPDDFEKRMEAKSMIYQENLDKGSIEINDIAERLYEEHPEILEELKEKLQKYNLQEEKINPQKKATVQKFERQLLTTDQGIEINIPMEQYLAAENISITTNPDGTLEVTIKNINNITAR
jgi:hypothetical protein